MPRRKEGKGIGERFATSLLNSITTAQQQSVDKSQEGCSVIGVASKYVGPQARVYKRCFDSVRLVFEAVHFIAWAGMIVLLMMSRYVCLDNVTWGLVSFLFLDEITVANRSCYIFVSR